VLLQTVAFGSDESSDVETLWEGRIFDEHIVWEPTLYPRSLYRSLHLVWYKPIMRGGRAEWCFDPEQTDNHVSPWEAEPSPSHERWRAALRDRPPTARAPLVRGVREHTLAEHVLVQRVLRRLVACEAADHFFEHEAADEQPFADPSDAGALGLQQMVQRAAERRYPTYAAFREDVEQMLDHSFLHSDECSIEFILTCMMAKEVRVADDELRAAGITVRLVR
jgi:hypothetical protein